MYIKQIIIQGFKSYKEQTVIEPFSSGTNVIVGRNGSGKSNFFAAIRFVLSDAYTQMSREERQALLHEGSGSAVMSAYVEIIFDNNDDRFHTGNKEVVIRRTISLKKDEYAIDRKVVSSKNEVFSMLEMAGFSRVNPYYIVPQGRVTALTNMKEADRLKLLKEIAGTESYEARRTESRKIMNDTINKRDKIDELLKDVKERLDELEEEKEELRGFQTKDKERRCLEYAYYYQQQLAFNEALEEIEEAQRGADSSSEAQRLFREGEQECAEMEQKLLQLQQSLELLEIEKHQLEDDRRETSRAKAKAELRVRDLADTQANREKAKKQHDTDLKAVRKEIAEKEAELAKIIPEYNKRKDKEAKVKQALDTADASRLRLLNKQSRSSQFRSRAERDAWLRKEIDDLNLKLSTHKANLLDTDEDIVDSRAKIKKLELEIAGIRKDLETFGSRQSDIKNRLSKAQERYDSLSEERRSLRREEDKLNSMISNAKKERDAAERKLSESMDAATSRGLATIERLKRERNIPGAYGILANLLEVNEAYRIPVEQVAGNSLFHYVVDNVETGQMLMEALEKQKGGRITFMPLAQLRPRNVNIPRSHDAVPLTSKITYEPRFEKAIQHVFGRSVLCTTLALANQYSRSHGVDAITLDGDNTSKRGTLTGGYTDPKKSRLLAIREAGRHREEYDRLVAQADEVRRQMELKGQEITTAMGEFRKLQQEQERFAAGFEPLKAELKSKDAQLDRANEHLERATRRREVIDRDMKDFGESLAGFEAEIGLDFKKALSPQEEQQLEGYSDQVRELRKQWGDCSRRRGELERRKQILEVDLRQDLRLREDQLTSQVFETSTSSSSAAGTGAGSGGGGVGDGDGSYSDAQKELKKLQKRAEQLERRFSRAEADIEAAAAEVAEVESRKAQKEQEQQELAKGIEKLQKKLGKGLQRKALLTAQIADCAKNIRDLGAIPDQAFEKYQRMDAKKIATKLKAVNEALKKYKHVNKKAFEQYDSFTTQQEQLVKRRKELDSSQKSIEDLVNHLDQKKDEAIERTFKQVSKEFANIFQRLVPAGHGRLVIQRRADKGRQQQQRDQDEESDEENRSHSVENYTGVGISVSFNSKEFDEQQKIQQLSGGQKSLCALCLIFAIQQTESSPMVVFDEVDANLDAQYRTAVADLLESISREAGTQFICTTFRPEIVHVADKCYGVTFTNKTSSIDCVPTESALSFVEGQQAGKR